MPFQVFLRERTDPGLVREVNEDFHGYFQPPDPAVRVAKGSLYIVADGMGGYAAGELASQWAIRDIIYEYYNDPDSDPAGCLRRAIEAANYAVHTNATIDPSRKGMGCTVVAAVVWGNLLIVGHVGDSRAYLVRNGQIARLTEDHSWVAEALRQGLITPEQAVNHPNRNIITRSLGGDSTVEVDINHYTLQAGDTIILCTDGLHGVVSDEEIAQAASYEDPSQIPAKLISTANERGGPDNVTVTVLRLYAEGSPLPHHMTDTVPYQPEPPQPLEEFSGQPARRAPARKGGLIAFLRKYPTITWSLVALLFGIAIVALIAILAQRCVGGPPPPKSSTGVETEAQSTLELTERPTAVPTPAPSAEPTPIPPSGRLAFVDPQGFLNVVEVKRQEDGRPYLVASTPTVTLTNVPDVHHPTWSPDGQWLAFQLGGSENTDGEIWIVEWTQNRFGQPQPLKVEDGATITLTGRFPAWSPDGQWLAYSYDLALWHCRLKTPEGNEGWICLEAAKLVDTCWLDGSACEDRYPAWSPDGKLIAFTRVGDDDGAGIDIWSGGDRGDIWVVDTGGGDPQNWTDNGEIWDAFPAWAPDGTRLAWSTTVATGAFNLGVADEIQPAGKLIPTKTWNWTGVEPAWGAGGWIVFAYIPELGAQEARELRFVQAGNGTCLCADGTKIDCGGDCTRRKGREPAWWEGR